MRKYLYLFIALCFNISFVSAADKCDYQNKDLKNKLLSLNGVVDVISKDFLTTPYTETPFKHIILFKDNMLAVVEQKHCVITNLTISLYSGEEVSIDTQLNRLANITDLMPSIKQFVIADDFSQVFIGSQNIKKKSLNSETSFIVNLTNQVPVRNINSSIYLEYSTSDDMFSLYQRVLTLYVSFGGHD